MNIEALLLILRIYMSDRPLVIVGQLIEPVRIIKSLCRPVCLQDIVIVIASSCKKNVPCAVLNILLRNIRVRNTDREDLTRLHSDSQALLRIERLHADQHPVTGSDFLCIDLLDFSLRQFCGIFVL